MRLPAEELPMLIPALKEARQKGAALAELSAAGCAAMLAQLQARP
jgi:hypothetical protein